MVNSRDAAELLAAMREQPKNRSSPDIDLAGVAAGGREGEGQEEGDGRRLSSGQRKRSASDELGKAGEDPMSSHQLSQSANSRVSIQSSVTLTEGRGGREREEEGEREVGGEGETAEEDVLTPLQKSSHAFPSISEEPPVSAVAATASPTTTSGSTREERAGTLNSDMSGSCSTLQNERQDGEMESSLDQSRKQQQMSVSFRQELLGVCQVKTDSRISLEVARLAEPDFDVVQLLGRSLPHVVPNVSLSKREVREGGGWSGGCGTGGGGGGGQLGAAAGAEVGEGVWHWRCGWVYYLHARVFTERCVLCFIPTWSVSPPLRRS